MMNHDEADDGGNNDNNNNKLDFPNSYKKNCSGCNFLFASVFQRDLLMDKRKKCLFKYECKCLQSESHG